MGASRNTLTNEQKDRARRAFIEMTSLGGVNKSNAYYAIRLSERLGFRVTSNNVALIRRSLQTAAVA